MEFAMKLSTDLLGLIFLSTFTQANNIDLGCNTNMMLILFFLLADEHEEEVEERERCRCRERERRDNFGAFQDGCLRFN